MMFSNSYTCQDWTIGKRAISGVADANLTRCYDLQGKNLVAKYYGAAAIIWRAGRLYSRRRFLRHQTPPPLRGAVV